MGGSEGKPNTESVHILGLYSTDILHLFSTRLARLLWDAAETHKAKKQIVPFVSTALNWLLSLGLLRRRTPRTSTSSLSRPTVRLS